MMEHILALVSIMPYEGKGASMWCSMREREREKERERERERGRGRDCL